MSKNLRTKAQDWIADRKKIVSQSSGFRGLKICKKCFTFNYANSWHFERPEYLNFEDDQDISVRFTECPTCLIEQNLSVYNSDQSFA